MTKRIAIAPKPEAVKPVTPDDWVKSRGVTENQPMKRLTLDIPADLHTRIKVSCAGRGTKMAEELREILEQHYNKTS